MFTQQKLTDISKAACYYLPAFVIFLYTLMLSLIMFRNLSAKYSSRRLEINFFPEDNTDDGISN